MIPTALVLDLRLSAVLLVLGVLYFITGRVVMRRTKAGQTAVESHHSVTRVDYKTFTPFFMVHMAQCITRSPDLLPPWHFQVAEEFGLTEKLEVWRNAVPSIQRAM